MGWGEAWVIAELLLSPLGEKAKPFPESQRFLRKGEANFHCPNLPAYPDESKPDFVEPFPVVLISNRVFFLEIN